MKIQIIRKKAASLRELGHEEMEIEPVSVLRELLTAVARAEFDKQHGAQDKVGRKQNGMKEGAEKRQVSGTAAVWPVFRSDEELRQQGRFGKIGFGETYNDNPGDWEKALATLFQDFEDGLYRVYVDGTEYTELSQQISLSDGAEVVFIRLTMLSGMLW